MILPIYKYGQPVLRKMGEEIDPDYPKLKELIDNMYQTMYHAEGIGLAAPQIGLSIRLFVIDLSPLAEDNPENANFKMVMINPEIVWKSEETVVYEEGCLSVPGINEKVERPDKIKIVFDDIDFNEQELTLEGFQARVVQHEYDHIEGKLFTDKVRPIRRSFIKTKLANISKGKVDCKYKIK